MPRVDNRAGLVSSLASSPQTQYVEQVGNECDPARASRPTAGSSSTSSWETVLIGHVLDARHLVARVPASEPVGRRVAGKPGIAARARGRARRAARSPRPRVHAHPVELPAPQRADSPPSKRCIRLQRRPSGQPHGRVGQVIQLPFDVVCRRTGPQPRGRSTRRDRWPRTTSRVELVDVRLVEDRRRLSRISPFARTRPPRPGHRR